MRVVHLSLTDFRNYARAELPLTLGANLFAGRNGQGKTNLVESLGYLSTLGSHRTPTDQAMIRKGADSAVIRACLASAERELLVEVQLNRGSANRAQVNRSVVKMRELPRYFSSVLFAPEDLALVRGEPGTRRRFLDQLLVQGSPRLSGVLSDYDRVLKQRNTLLKSARSSRVREDQLTTLDIWDERLVALGSEIIDERWALLAVLAEPLRNAYRAVAGEDHGPRARSVQSIWGSDAGVDTEDPDSVPVSGDRAEGEPNVAERTATTADQFRSMLRRIRPKELERGLTLIGPHRDDVLFELNGMPAKGYASHGESWSFALALKLASAELLRERSTTGDPVLILDDVFAELDQTRRGRLAGAVQHYEQVLITAAVLEDVPQELTGNTVHIVDGTIQSDGASAQVVHD